MWQKSRAIWKYINFHYMEDFDWFVLGGDDLFIIVENLRKVWRGRCGAKLHFFALMSFQSESPGSLSEVLCTQQILGIY